MIKNRIILSSILLIFFISSIGCSNSNEKKVTIAKNSDSEYVNTFEELSLGLLFDFELKLPQADKRWINLWVERYIDGKKDPEPLTHLSYGNSPKENDEGKLGFGMINPSSEDSLLFLYGPNVRTHPTLIENEPKTDIFTAWDYAIGDEEVEIKMGETKVLAIYLESNNNFMRSLNLSDEESIKNIIKEHNTVLLLKIKIQERDISKE
ncbi:hypothetical protein [Lederbergia graminis]|uniref:Lipoprotein n=1 Tax=Lederbergia graminis TaxID=735518 RepID=A0ABW0LHB6_9BACI